MMDEFIDEFFEGKEIESTWKEKLEQQKLLLLTKLSEHVVSFFEEAEIKEMRLFSLEKEWGIHYLFLHKGTDYKIYSKTGLLGDFLYCEGKILTDYWGIEHGECSIIHELFMGFLKENLTKRNINFSKFY